MMNLARRSFRRKTMNMEHEQTMKKLLLRGR
jgi:hypothetical protein